MADIATTSHIEIRANREGAARAFIAGTRVRVQDVYVLSELDGRQADEIVQAYPQLTLGQVHAALSYYFDHMDQIREEIRQDEEFVRQFRQQASTTNGVKDDA